MHLKFCAFTGPDDAVNPEDLAALSKQYPFAEWSILYSPNDQGKPRSPTESWIRKFKDICADTHTCMHLCDTALPALVSGDANLLDLMKGFKRIQLNLEYMDAGRRLDPAALAARVKVLPQWEFIIQYGKKYKHFLLLMHLNIQ
jgi:phosphoribosylanthranilate isomerase